MDDLRKKHQALCSKFDSAVIEYNHLHRQAKWVNLNTIVPLEKEIRKLEEDIKKKQKLIGLERG